MKKVIVVALLCVLAAISSAPAQDSLNVSQVGQTFIADNVNQMAWHNGHLFYSSGSDRWFYEADVSNPAAPVIADSCSLGYNSQSPGYSTFIHGDYAYVPGYSHLSIIDLNQMTQVYFDTTGQQFRFDPMAICGDLACAIGTDSTWEQEVFEVLGFDGYMPYVIGQCNFPGFFVREIAIQGNYAYVACDLYGLQIVDISDPTHPVLVGWTTTPGNAWGLAVQGNYVYMVENYAGLRVIDVSNPDAPVQVGFCALPGEAFGVDLEDNLAYVADAYNGGLRIVNISDPTAPVEVGWYDTPGCAHDVVVNGSLAYMTDFPYLGIYDCLAAQMGVSPAVNSHPASFALEPARPNPFNPSTAISYQLSANCQVSLQVYNVSGKLTNTLVDEWQTAGAHQVTFDGKNLAAGIYFARLEAGNFRQMQKLVLVK